MSGWRKGYVFMLLASVALTLAAVRDTDALFICQQGVYARI